MDNNARVRIQVDDSRVKELRQSAAELYDKFAKNAREQAKDLKEINRHISEQIHLLEERNRKMNESGRVRLEGDLRSGVISRRVYESGVRDIDTQRSAQQARVQALREMLDIDTGPGVRAQSLFSDISREAVLRGGDVSSGIDEGIRRFEQKSKIEQSQRAFQLRSRYDQGYLSREQYASGLKSIRADKQGDALLIKLLREIADNTRNDAKESAEELVKRLRISSRSDASKWIERLETKRTGSAEDIIRRQEASKILKQQFEMGEAGGGLSQMFSGGGIRQLISKFAPLSVTMPALGALAAAHLAWKGIGRYGEVVSGARDLAAINPGMQLSDVWSMGLDRGDVGTKLGLSGEAFLAKRLAYQRSTGRLISADEALNNFAQQRALGLSDDQYNQMLSLGRFSTGGTGQGALSALERIAQRRFGNLALLPELISTYQSAAQNILSVRGDFNQNALVGVIQGLSIGTGAQGAQLNRLVGGLQNIGNNSNPLANAMAYRVARMVDPNIDVWGASKLIEDPLSNTEFLKTYLQQIQKNSGGGTSAKFLAKALLPGLSFDDIDKLFGASGDRDFEKILGEVRTGQGGDYRPRGEELTSFKEYVEAQKQLLEDLAVNFGKSASEMVRSEVLERQRIAKKTEELLDRSETLLDKINRTVTLQYLNNPMSQK